MQDKTAWYMVAIVGIVAATSLIFYFTSGVGNSGNGNGLTGFATYEGGSQASSGGVESGTAPIQTEPSPAKRTLTILSVAFLLGIAAYLYFNPEY